MEKWLNTKFESSCNTTPQFTAFVKDFKKEVSRVLGKDFKVKLDKGHFYISGFIEKNGKYVYLSISDVRYYQNQWSEKIMIRTASHNKDYTGGENNYTSLALLRENVNKLFIRQSIDKAYDRQSLKLV